MKIVGIIAEYNPFHLGHRYQLQEIKAQLGEDCAFICCMSGNFVQRGEPALLDKWTRARMALESGADLIVELPTPWAAASAQRFARGAAALLHASGVVDMLAFGSESGDLAALRTVAACLETPPYREALRTALNRGLPFAAARQEAVRACAGSAADCLSGPNDILGVEYLSALRRLNSGIAPLAVLRTGAGHDGGPVGGIASASHIRALLRDGREEEAGRYLPSGVLGLLAGAPAADWRRGERAALARLRTMEEEEFLDLPDCGEGLHRRLMAAAREAGNLAALLERAKTKRYAAARIRRAVLWAYLGLKASAQPETPPCWKVLGFTGRGAAILKRMKETCALPVVVKPASGRDWTGPAGFVLRQEARCTDLYGLLLEQVPPCGREWRESPVRLLD